jgi:hypothetical protein
VATAAEDRRQPGTTQFYHLPGFRLRTRFIWQEIVITRFTRFHLGGRRRPIFTHNPETLRGEQLELRLSSLGKDDAGEFSVLACHFSLETWRVSSRHSHLEQVAAATSS